VNRDNALFLLVGLLGGFLAGYVAHEAMTAVQPARAPAGAAVAPHPPVAEGGGQPAMSEINRLREIVERNPEDREALRALANMNFDIGNWARAQELYERYLTLDPDNPDVLTDLGISIRSQGDFNRALELFRSEAGDPAHWQSTFNESSLAFGLSDRRGGAAARRAARLAPGNPDVGAWRPRCSGSGRRLVSEPRARAT
jgi:tetratricopeptide (TPR) repeat protein